MKIALNNPGGLSWGQTGMALGVGVIGMLAAGWVAKQDIVRNAGISEDKAIIGGGAILYTIGVILGSKVGSSD